MLRVNVNVSFTMRFAVTCIWVPPVVVETEKWTQQRMTFFSSHDKITAVREFVQMAFALLCGAGRGHGSARFARRALSNARIPSIVDRGPPLWRDKP